MASSASSQYRRDPATGLFMPTVVQINCPQAQFSMRIDLGDVEINRLSGHPVALWSMPSYPVRPSTWPIPISVPPCSPRLESGNRDGGLRVGTAGSRLAQVNSNGGSTKVGVGPAVGRIALRIRHRCLNLFPLRKARLAARHSERSEESWPNRAARWILRCAQNDARAFSQQKLFLRGNPAPFPLFPLWAHFCSTASCALGTGFQPVTETRPRWSHAS